MKWYSFDLYKSSCTVLLGDIGNMISICREPRTRHNFYGNGFGNLPIYHLRCRQDRLYSI